MPAFLSRFLLVVALSGVSLPALALPTLGLGPFGPGVQDGSAPFDTDGACASDTAIAAAGDDCGEKNNQVRTQDTVTYNWSVTANNYTTGQANPENVIFEQVLTPSTNAVIAFERIPAICTEDGGGGTNPVSSITKSNGISTLTCNLGEFNEGAQLSFSSVVKISGESWNGTSFSSTQRVYSNEDDGITPNAVPATSADIGPIQISSRPRADLSSSGFRGYYLYGKREVNPAYGVENGYYTWINLRVATDQKTGTESIQQPFDFLMNVTATKGAENGDDYTSSGFEYYMISCAYNPYFWPGQVYGREAYGASNLTAYPLNRKVLESGTCSYSRDDVSQRASPYRISIDNADLSGSRFPEVAGGGIDLKAGPYYYTNTVARFFIPMRVIDMSDGVINGTGGIYIKSVLEDFNAKGVSGIDNYNGAKEPGYNGQAMPDGTISNNIAPAYPYELTTKGAFADYAFKTSTDLGSGYTLFVAGNNHSGQGLVAPGQAYANTLHFGNSGSTDLENPRTCLAFDNTTQKLTDRSNVGATAGTYAYVGTYTGSTGFDASNYIVEYGTVDISNDDPISGGYNDQLGRYEGDWSVQRAVRCDDGLTDWKTDPTQVGSGIDDVNVVRARLKDSVADSVALSSSQYIRFVTPLEIRQTFYKGTHDGELIPVGTTAAAFGSARDDQYWKNWTSRSYSPSPESSAAHYDGDRVTVARTTSRLDSESLTPEAAPGATSSTIAGKQIVWKLTTAIQSLLETPPDEENVQIINELPPEVSYNQSCTAEYTDEDGNVIGTPADLVQYNTDRDGNAKTGYTRLVWNLGTVTANDEIAPRVICTDSDPLVPNGTAVMNYAEIRGDTLISALSVRSDTHTITLEQIGSIQVSKEVDSTLDDVNDEQKYVLSWANFAPSFAIDAPTLIDVFPYNGDSNSNNARSPESEFSGVLELTGAPSTTWLGGEVDGAPLGTWYYTTDSPETINYDPDKNASTWVDEAALAGDFSNVTAIKFVSAYKLEKDGDPHQGMKASYTLKIGDSSDPESTFANKPGDKYSNLFTLDTQSLPAEQYLKSNTTTVEVASYYVGDLVFADVDGDLKYTDGIDIPVPDGVTVELRKKSDNSLVDTTTTGIVGRGRYVFADVGSGEFYVLIPASQFVDGAVLKSWDSLVTAAGTDDDINEIDDQDGYKAAAVVTAGVRTNSFTLSATEPLPGDVPKGNEPLGDNVAGLTMSRGDDFTNLTIDIGLKPALDFGDAPDSYGDAGHGLPFVPLVYLGTIAPDNELAPQNQANGGIDGTGDNKDGKLDEDGLTFIEAVNTTDTRLRTSVSVVNRSANDARVMVWVDFNQNGTFEASEAQSTTVSAGFGSVVQLEWSNLAAGTIKAGELWVRARISTDDNLTASNAAGALFDGEVEDYVLQVSGGVKVSGRVFIDADGDGVNDSGELGIVRHTVVLRETDSGVCQSAYTDSDGNYAFSAIPTGSYQVYQAQGESVPVPGDCDPAAVTNPLGYQSTSPDLLSFNVVATDVINQNFGEVKSPIFEPDHQSEILPGNVVFYAHRFSTPTAGAVRFTPADDLNTMAGWSHAIYRDGNCDGVLNGSEAAAPISGMNFGVGAGSSFCIINKVFAPANVPQGDRYRVTTTAAFSYASATASTVNLMVRDVTTAGANVSPAVPATPVIPEVPATTVDPATPEIAATPVTPAVGASRLVLRKTVQNATQNTDETETVNQAAPGDRLTYRIYYRNTGTGPITDLQVNDAVPNFTEYVLGSASCDGEPSGLNCSPNVSGSYLEWLFTGTLSGGAQGSVSYDVKVDE